ncbi:MAG: copper resistance CopC/CopD family protein [Ilumatobacteraceae bacterium]
MKHLRRLLLVVVAILLGVLVPATGALAHGELLGSEPAASSVLAESPAQIVLYFNESIEPVFGSIRILDLTGQEIFSGVPHQDSGDHSIVRTSIPLLGDGTYVVIWRVTSADGHRVQGAFPFYVGIQQNSATELVATYLHSYHADPSGNKVSTLLRWVVFVGVIVLIGSLVFSGMLMRPADLDSRSVTVVAGAWLLAFIGSGAALIAYGPSATGTRLVNLSLIPDTLRTAFGQATAIRMALLVATAVLVYLRRRLSPRLWQVMAMLLSVGILATLSLSGHPVVQRPAVFSVVIDMVHLLAVSVWIGGIAVLALGVQSWFIDKDGAVVHRFSSIAPWAVLTIVVTGVSQAWVMMDGFGTVLSTNYGRTLIVKTTAVAVLVSLGMLSRLTLKRNGPASVKQVVGVELVIGLMIVAISALLVGTPPRPSPVAEPFVATLVRSSVIADVTITPTRVGQAEVHVIVTPPGGALGQVISASARVSLPERNIPNIPIELIKTGPNHFTGVVNIAYAGTWELEILVVPTENMTLLYQTSFRVTD